MEIKIPLNHCRCGLRSFSDQGIHSIVGSGLHGSCQPSFQQKWLTDISAGENSGSQNLLQKINTQNTKRVKQWLVFWQKEEREMWVKVLGNQQEKVARERARNVCSTVGRKQAWKGGKSLGCFLFKSNFRPRPQVQSRSWGCQAEDVGGFHHCTQARASSVCSPPKELILLSERFGKIWNLGLIGKCLWHL